MRLTYYEETRYYRPPKKSSPGDMFLGGLCLLLVAAGAISNGWGGAACGFILALVLCGLFGKNS